MPDLLYHRKQAPLCFACYLGIIYLLSKSNRAKSHISDLIYSVTTLTSHSWSRSVSY